jgi:hypothetical protein
MVQRRMSKRPEMPESPYREIVAGLVCASFVMLALVAVVMAIILTE